jgi:hypothetical protein
VKRRRSLVVVAALGTVVLAACGASAPPARELADEMIETLEQDGEPLPDSVKDCMHAVVADFRLTDEEAQGFDDLDEVASKAADGQEQAIQIIARFQDELEACNTPG